MEQPLVLARHWVLELNVEAYVSWQLPEHLLGRLSAPATHTHTHTHTHTSSRVGGVAVVEGFCV